MFCAKCGTEIKPGQKFCAKCGAPVKQPGAAAQTPKEPVKKKEPKEPVRKEQPIRQEVVEKKDAQTQTTGQKPVLLVVIGVAVLVIVLLLVVILKLTVFSGDNATSDRDAQTEETVRTDEPEDQTDDVDASDVDAESEDDTETADDTDSNIELLREKYLEITKKLGDARGRSYDVKKTEEAQDYGAIGLMGAIIQDISGDGVEDLVVVCAEDSFETIYADVYTVEDGAVVEKAENLLLSEGMAADNSTGVAYLKKTSDGWNLIGDTATLYCHYADGAHGLLMAYACGDHSYKKIVDYGYAGSDLFEEEPRMVRKGQDAGLQITSAPWLEPELYAAMDRDVKVFMGYELRVDESFDFSDWYESPAGIVFGTLQIARLTGDDCLYDKESANDFMDQYESVAWSDTASADGDYIFPDSDTRKLTAEDLDPIKDDAQMLRLARNELYARHGRKFDAEDLQEYFMSKDWYMPEIDPEDFDEDMLTKVEKYNRDLIKSYEE